MAKFQGMIGILSTEETEPGSGIFAEIITERSYRIDILKNSRHFQSSSQLNDDLVLNNTFSIISDDYLLANAHMIRFVKLNGVFWKVTNVEIQRSRLVLTVGGIYNKP